MVKSGTVISKLRFLTILITTGFSEFNILSLLISHTSNIKSLSAVARNSVVKILIAGARSGPSLIIKTMVDCEVAPCSSSICTAIFTVPLYPVSGVNTMSPVSAFTVMVPTFTPSW
ncbi:hypothetical protein FQZ97_1139540 [compost metagenome]